ncbi:MAG: hypothetical protein B7Z55_04680 [Planctomycetales bacterium 12-60-4]|nr:MAG: hypothetical protein B7Z55_04680 [Planctomycetales bacterium 12-60-4]
MAAMKAWRPKKRQPFKRLAGKVKHGADGGVHGMAGSDIDGKVSDAAQHNRTGRMQNLKLARRNRSRI